MHNTEGAESAHKVNMHLASLRARHMDANYTQDRMLKYLRWYLVFESLYDKPAPVSRQFRPGLSAVLPILCLRRPLPRNFTTVAFQSAFLHHQVPLVGVEFLNLLCAQFELPPTRRSYTYLQRLNFQIGLKCTREEDHKTFSSTGGQRDMLRLRGHEEGNSLCCETICFVQVDNVLTLPRQHNDVPDRRILVLVRWFSPHADSWERDSLRRPLCPGPLSINNCLWTYSRTPRPRRALVDQDGQPTPVFREYARTACGLNNDDVLDLHNREKHAYYGFITPNNIASRVNMAPTFQHGSDVPDYSRWLETVTMH